MAKGSSPKIGSLVVSIHSHNTFKALSWKSSPFKPIFLFYTKSMPVNLVRTV